MIVINTRISSVTVYADRALVTRRGIINLTGTETALILTGLPTTLDAESVRASGKGQVAVKLQGVRIDRQYTSEPVGERIAHITTEIDRIEAQKRQLQGQIETAALQSQFIEGFRLKTETSFSRSLAQQQVSLDDTLNLLNFIGSKYAEYTAATENLRSQQQQLDRQLQAFRAQLQQIKTPQTRQSFDLIVSIEPSGAGEFQLDVNYVVDRASWTPLYDLRVQSHRQTLQLSYLAEVTQTTGEDWENVQLTLSTAKPGLGTLPPTLDPWYIDILTPAPLAPMKRARAMSASEDTMLLAAAPAPAAMIYQEIAESAAPEYLAETVVAAISHQGSVVTFQIGGGGNIPSDGNPHKATIFDDNFPCELEYIAMPRLVSFAYLQATAKNSASGATLLPGKANIFRDEMFVGTTDLANIAPGQEFKLNLGIDEGIKIDRELTERQVDKKFLGGNRQITYSYRLMITNLLSTAAHLELIEQIPHSRNEQIKVKLTKTNPPISLGEMGRLVWSLDLPADGKLNIDYQFTIEHGERTQITGLDI